MVERSTDFAWLRREVDAHRYPVFFAVLSGAHMYGFASGDSDYDLRGAHVLPLEEVVGLDEPDETVDAMYDTDAREIDVVTHDLAKFMRLMLAKNAMVLEQVFARHVIYADDDFDELRHLAAQCITRHHAHHYLGFGKARWQAFVENRRLKALLYAYRGYLSGIHLMRTGRVETDLGRLAHEYAYPELFDLIEAKQAGTEKMQLDAASVARHRPPVEELRARLQQEHEQSELREVASTEVATQLSELLVRVRLRTRRG